MTSNTVTLDEADTGPLENSTKDAVEPEAQTKLTNNAKPEATCKEQGKPVEEDLKEESLLNGRHESPNKEGSASNEGGASDASVEVEDLTEEEKLKTRIGRLVFDETGYDKVVNQKVWESKHKAGNDIESQFALFLEGNTLWIYSAYIQKVFRAVVQYYPTVTYAKTFILLAEPYPSLFHYYSQMCEYAAHDTPDPSESPGDFEVFKLFYQSQLASDHDKIRTALTQQTVQFAHLWALYCPGELLYTRDDFDQPQIYSIISGKFKEAEKADRFNNTPEKPWRYCVDGWFTTWDESAKKFTRSFKTTAVNTFEGTRDLTSFACYPLKYHTDDNPSEVGKLQNSLEARGNAWKRLVSSPSCQHYEGMSQQYYHNSSEHVDDKLIALNGRVIVDQEGGRVQGTVVYQTYSKSNDEELKIKPMSGTDHDSRYLGLDDHSPDKPFTSLQAQLCPSTLSCFSLQDEKWYKITVDSISAPSWSKSAFNHLVLDESLKVMLRGLVEHHKRNKGRVMGDVIDKKGKGLVVVLHGPPGVGKTLTAETVAELTEKPLYQINISDVANDDGLHIRLRAMFTRASKWDAVILLDEADVLLEKRSYEDLRRNAVVSGKHSSEISPNSLFLRILEYYEGILFMTTNRLRTMDPAFKSRVHIAVRYKDLTSQQRRRIWSNFIDLLDDSESQAKEEMREHLDDMQEWELNGRQIRNVLMIAHSLALSTQRMRGTLRFDHVESVARQTIGFQHFFDEDEKSSRSLLDTVPSRRFREFTSG